MGPTSEGAHINNKTYADDMTTITSSNKDLNTLATIINDYFKWASLDFAPGKSVYGSRMPLEEPDWAHPKLITVDGGPDTGYHGHSCIAPAAILEPGQAMRILGAYFTMELDWKPQIQILNDKIRTATASLAVARAPISLVAEVINGGLLPSITYPLQVARIPDSVRTKWHSSIMKAAKSAAGFARSTPSWHLQQDASKAGPALNTLEAAIDATLVGEYQVRMFTPGLTRDMAIERLLALRDVTGLPGHPLSHGITFDAQTVALHLHAAIGNVCTKLGLLAQAHSTEFCEPDHEGDVPIARVLGWDRFVRVRPELAKWTPTPRWVSQLLSKKGTLLTWGQLSAQLLRNGAPPPGTSPPTGVVHGLGSGASTGPPS